MTREYEACSVVKKQKYEGLKLTSIFSSLFLCASKTVTDEDEEEINPDIFKVKPALLVRIKLS